MIDYLHKLFTIIAPAHCLNDAVPCHAKVFQFPESHVLIVDLSACTISVLFRKSLPVPNDFKAIPYFFFYQVQGIGFCVEF